MVNIFSIIGYVVCVEIIQLCCYSTEVAIDIREEMGVTVFQ